MTYTRRDLWAEDDTPIGRCRMCDGPAIRVLPGPRPRYCSPECKLEGRRAYARLYNEVAKGCKPGRTLAERAEIERQGRAMLAAGASRGAVALALRVTVKTTRKWLPQIPDSDSDAP